MLAPRTTMVCVGSRGTSRTMGWFSETAGERYARLNGENTRRMQQGARERDDINHQRSQEATYQRQNWQHKTLTFEAEQRLARSEGRYPIYASPAQVPDMPRGGEEQQSSSSDFTIPPVAILAVLVIIAGSILMSILAALGPIVDFIIRMAILAIFVGAIALTLVWLVMHFTAKDDPEKIRRAKLFNPVRVAKVLTGFAVDSYKERKARKNAG